MPTPTYREQAGKGIHSDLILFLKEIKEKEMVSRRNNEFAFCCVNVKLTAEH